MFNDKLDYTDLEDALDLLLEIDDEIGHVWKMPNPYDCVQFAFTEMGEVVNARINQSKSGYARNNQQKDDGLERELADVGMMILKYFVSDNEKDIEKVKAILKREYINGPLRKSGPYYLPGNVRYIVDQEVNDLSRIAILITYAMNVLEQHGMQSEVNTVLACTLFLIMGHELFEEQSFIEYLEEKVLKIVDKVNAREMHVQ